MLTLRTLAGAMLALDHSMVHGIEQAGENTIIYCGGIVHKVTEDFETVWDMFTGLRDTDDSLDEPEHCPAGFIHPAIVHADLSDQGMDTDSIHHIITDQQARSQTLGLPDHDHAGRPVIAPPVQQPTAPATGTNDPGPAKGGENEN